VGFVFQNFQLIPTLTAIENVQVPLELRAGRQPTMATMVAPPTNDSPAARARELLTRVGLAERLSHFPTQLSGGEQQRVALARAFVNRPTILFADEPTGNLDATTGMRVIELLESINRDSHATIVLVTHDDQLANRATRVIRLADGRIVSDSAATPHIGFQHDVTHATPEELIATPHHESPHHTQPR
jgi:putative ABC transport system ATP-binding protein